MSLLDGIGSILKVVDLPGTLISEGCQLLGLPPVVGDIAKVGLGTFTGDFLMVADGLSNGLGDAERSMQAQTSYLPSANPAIAGCGWAPVGACGGMPGDYRSQCIQSLSTLLMDFPQAESAGALFHTHDGLLSLHDLNVISNDLRSPLDLKRAARFVLEHPDVWNMIARTRPGLFGPSLASAGDLQLALQDLEGGCCPMPGGFGPGYPPPLPIPGSWGGPPGILGAPGYLPGFDGGILGGPLGRPGYTGFPPPMGGPCGWPGMGSPFGCIFDNPALSTEDKIEALLQQAENATDQQIIQLGAKMQNLSNQLRTTTDTGQQQSIQNDLQQMQLQMQSLVEKRKNYFDTMSNIMQKFNEMSMVAIQNLGR